MIAFKQDDVVGYSLSRYGCSMTWPVGGNMDIAQSPSQKLTSRSYNLALTLLNSHIFAAHAKAATRIMPASQLSQLKAALSSAGLNRKTTSKKDKKAWKKGGVREVDRAKSLAKLEDIRKGLNKFDERETRVSPCQVRRAGRSCCALRGAGADIRRSSTMSVDEI
jgi:nucleolar protein 14